MTLSVRFSLTQFCYYNVTETLKMARNSGNFVPSSNFAVPTYFVIKNIRHNDLLAWLFNGDFGLQTSFIIKTNKRFVNLKNKLRITATHKKISS